MADPLEHVQPGDGLAIRASTFNMLIDAARAHRATQGRVGPGVKPADPLVPSNLVYVRNTTGSTMLIWSVVTPTGLAIDPADSTETALSARRTPAFDVSAPVTASDPVLITVEPIAAGEIGRAMCSGCGVAVVDVTDTAHRYARPVVGNLFHLESAESGPACLLAPNGVGTYRTMVLLGGPPPTEQWWFNARLTSRTGSVWDFVPLALNSSGVYVDVGDELTGARQLADPDTPLLPAITDIVPGTRVLMRRADTLDGTGEPQYEFRCTLPTVTACNIAPSERFAIATYGQPEELGLPTVCLGEIELPGPGLYLLYATAYASLRMNGMPSVQYGPNLTCATMYFDADDLGIVDGSHLPSAVLTTLSTSATLDWVGSTFTPSGVAQEVNWGSNTLVFTHRSEDGAAVRLWGHCGNWSGFEAGPGAGRIPAYGDINNVAFGFIPLCGATINETCNACESPPPDSGSGGGGGGSETFYCFELGETVTMTLSNKAGDCTALPDEIVLTRYTDPGAYEYEWRGEYTMNGESRYAIISCPSTINPWGVRLNAGGETIIPVSQDEDTLTLIWDLVIEGFDAQDCTGSVRLTMVGSG